MVKICCQVVEIVRLLNFSNARSRMIIVCLRNIRGTCHGYGGQQCRASCGKYARHDCMQGSVKRKPYDRINSIPVIRFSYTIKFIPHNSNPHSAYSLYSFVPLSSSLPLRLYQTYCFSIFYFSVSICKPSATLRLSRIFSASSAAKLPYIPIVSRSCSV